ncbi:MAG TPA: FAD-dependent oxidoreductase [Actinomycetales bacterium]|nr:FAD-dependent oxidoreductase [Actinomycetales bacterium]
MKGDRTIAIVGAGLAGATAAQVLRDEGFVGRVVLLGEEAERPYERPPLSKGFLQGETPRDKVFVHDAGWYAEHDVDLRLSARVTGLDRRAHEVTLADGERVRYEALLLATGSSPRRLQVPGAELSGVHYLRRLEDSDRLKSAFESSERVVVVGAGWIGLESAAAARAAGLSVTIIEPAALPLLRVLGPEVAQVFAGLHRDHDVDLRLRAGVSALVGADGAVTHVVLSDGTRLPADLVVVGIGVTPNTSLAADAGLAVSDGVDVDEHLRSSDPDVYAAGDVAAAMHPSWGRRIRVEHWANARHQGRTAALSMLGRDAVHDRLPYFFTDQYDLGMEYTGYADGYDQVVVRGDVTTREFIAFWLRSGRVLAGMNVNVWDVVEDVGELVRSGRQVDVERLADPAVPLTAL